MLVWPACVFYRRLSHSACCPCSSPVCWFLFEFFPRRLWLAVADFSAKFLFFFHYFTSFFPQLFNQIPFRSQNVLCVTSLATRCTLRPRMHAATLRTEQGGAAVDKKKHQMQRKPPSTTMYKHTNTLEYAKAGHTRTQGTWHSVENQKSAPVQFRSNDSQMIRCWNT